MCSPPTPRRRRSRLNVPRRRLYIETPLRQSGATIDILKVKLDLGAHGGQGGRIAGKHVAHHPRALEQVDDGHDVRCAKFETRLRSVDQDVAVDSAAPGRNCPNRLRAADLASDRKS